MRKKSIIPEVSILNELFLYSDGNLIYKERDRKWFLSDGQYKVWHKRFLGKIAGKTNTGGHIQVAVDGRHYLAHRIIWAMINNGISHDVEIDHIDENKKNNNIENLRIASNGGNQQNVSKRKDNKSGVKGVHWYPRYKKWIAGARVNRKFVGKYFTDFDEAKEWASSLRKQLHGDFANNGSGCVIGTN